MYMKESRVQAGSQWVPGAARASWSPALNEEVASSSLERIHQCQLLKPLCLPSAVPDPICSFMCVMSCEESLTLYQQLLLKWEGLGTEACKSGQ